jgi:hypothetical protein
MAAGRRIAELASEPWQIGHGRTLCEEKIWASLEFPANLCCTFHNVRLSITGIRERELAKFQFYEDKRSKTPMEKQQIETVPFGADTKPFLAGNKREIVS